MSLRRVGFIGLGLMGKPMASNLVRAGFDVSVLSRSKGPIDELVALGAVAASDVGELCERSDAVITMLPTPSVTREVVLSSQGVLAALSPGSLFIDMGTEDPGLAREIWKVAQERGVGALDAPVSGGDVGAISGELSIMVGGDQDVFEKARPILEAMGSSIGLVGGPGSGQVVKSVNQIMVAGILATVAEGLALLETADVDVDAAIGALMAGRAGSRILEAKAKQMLENRFDPGFRVELHLKDLRIVDKFARDSAVALPFTALVTAFLEALSFSGGEALDHSAIIQVIRSLGRINLTH